MIEFKLPDIGEGVAEGEIVQWLVAEGASVAEHQSVVEVMTDKATVEIPAPAAGTVSRLLAAEGETVPVGSVIFHLETGAAPAAAPAPVAAAASAGGGTAVAAPPAAAAAAPAPVASAPAGGAVIEFKLPDIGEGVAEGEIVQWLVAEGASVDEHQSVVEVMTDKATVEIPAPAAGTLIKQLVEAGATVPVGEVLFHLASAGAVAAPTASAPSAPQAAVAQPAARSASNGKVLAVPSARRVARELGVDLAAVRGTGPNGVIRRADVESAQSQAPTAVPAVPAAPAVARPQPTAPQSAAPTQYLPPSFDEIRKPFRGVRRKISEAMVRSKTTAMHFTVVEEIDVTELVALRAKAKAIGAKQGVKVTYMPFIMKAVANGLLQHRMLNGHLDEATEELVLPGQVNLGIATDTPNGLIVPVIPSCESKGLLQLAAELGDLAERTRAGRMKPEELKGSTFTITNAGNIGGTFATPIINFPDIAILGVHRIVKRPGIVETPEGDEIAVRHYMNLSCSVDHRLADGADAARFLAYLRLILEDPGLLSL